MGGWQTSCNDLSMFFYTPLFVVYIIYYTSLFILYIFLYIWCSGRRTSLVDKLPSSKKDLKCIHIIQYLEEPKTKVKMDIDFQEDRQSSILDNESLVVMFAAIIAFLGQLVTIFLGIFKTKYFMFWLSASECWHFSWNAILEQSID